MSPELSRRAALAGLAAIAPAATAAALPAAIGDDAELIALGRQLETAAAVLDKINADDDEDRWEEAVTWEGHLIDRITAIPAVTIMGLRVKACAVERDTDVGRDTSLKSLLDDILRQAGAAA